jgi:hypothetical protein
MRDANEKGKLGMRVIAHAARQPDGRVLS